MKITLWSSTKLSFFIMKEFWVQISARNLTVPNEILLGYPHPLKTNAGTENT
jgi:hypothetical protein